jgi:formylmethanofuran dehydrogenase subunit C
MLTLRLKSPPAVPLEVEGVLPENVRDQPRGDIESLPIFHGNERIPLGDFFEVRGDPSDQRIEWEGDLSGVHWIGAKMSSGEIRMAGNAGRHLGSEMRGGAIHVSGSASDWVGGEMKGGLIDVRGSAGHLIGAAYRGSPRGMTGGTILVGGDVGNEIGHTMRRGLIAVGGSVGDLGGFNMLAGSILVFGNCGIRQGAGMKRGTMGFFGEPPELLLSFRYGCRFQPEILGLMLTQLRRLGFSVPADLSAAQIDLYHGDMIEGGRGEVLLRASP